MKVIACISIIIMMLCSCKSVENSANSTAYPTPPIIELPTNSPTPEIPDLPTDDPDKTTDTSLTETPKPSPTPQPKPSPKETWTGAEIYEYLESGGVSDTVSFKFGDSRETVEAELGNLTAEWTDSMELYMYGQIGVLYAPWEFAHLPRPPQFVTLVAFFEGEKFFGLEVGKATPDDVRALMEPPSESTYEGYDYGGFSVGSPGGREEGDPPPGEKYYFINCYLKLGTLIFHFTDGILETVAVYGPPE